MEDPRQDLRVDERRQERPVDDRRASGTALGEVFRMRIGGMSCSFCTSTIERAYRRLDGVLEVGVSLAHEEALVRYDPTRVDPTRLRRTLEDIGYTYRDPDEVRTFEEEEAELRRERLRLLLAATATLLSVLTMALGSWTRLVRIPAMAAILGGLAVATMFGTGWFIKRMAWASLRRGILNQHVLLEFAAFAGLVGGALGVFVLDGFPTGDFLATSTLVTTYHILSHYASLLVRTRASQAVRKLMALRPDTAWVVRDGREVEVPVEEVVVGDLVRIRPGASIPVDGRVVEGASAVDEVLVTGEPIPAEKVAGDEVIGGSVNLTGTLLVEVTRTGEEAFLNRVARAIEEARALRPGVLQLVDVVLRWFVPGVLVVAAAGLVGWLVGPVLAGGSPDVDRALLAGLAALVMGYPCALGMATPLATIRGGGEAARRGVLMRSGEAFAVMPRIEVVALDKTGTLTRGEPTVREVVATGGASEAEVLRWAAAAEKASEHPLARAVEAAAATRGIDVPDPEEFTAVPGQGVEATVAGARVRVGRLRWVTSTASGPATPENAPVGSGDPAAEAAPDRPGALEPAAERVASGDPAAEAAAERLASSGHTVVAVARDGRLLGLLGIADQLKEDAADTIAALRRRGLTPLMLTGDDARTARAVAAELGITEVRAEVLPDQKALVVRDLQRTGRRVMMVGDGINDAPALTQADVGVAIGAGTDIAIEAADVVVIGDRLAAVVDAYDIGVSSYRRTKQNLALAFSFNGIGVPAATTGLVSPVWAMVAMISSVTAVLLNSFLRR